MTDFRIEKDSLGEVKVPQNAYFGAFTSRAQKNFKISNLKAPLIFEKALGLIKLVAIQANASLKLIQKKEAQAIEKACLEFINHKYHDQFTLDIFQAGAGTSYNMNANEIIANRANELLGNKKGEYKNVNPNNHVNMAQSTNDVIPTATRLAALLSLPILIKEIKSLEESISKKAKNHHKTIKIGRTHLQDAVPISLWQEFDSYKEALQKSRTFIETQAEDLKILGIGGTAVGTGINTHPQYQKTIVSKLTKLTGIKFKPAKNLTEMANNMNSFMNFSASLRSLANNLLNLCSDLKLMNMGPKGGIGEITLPEVQEGSSIMPGKVNPSIPEAVEMVAIQVLGNDKVIEIAAQKSHFELNVMCPIIMYNLLTSMEILTNALKTLREFCIDGIKINTDRIEELFKKSLCTATALSPKLGYKKTAEIVKTALKNNSTIEAEVLKNKLLSKKELDELIKKSL